MQSHSSLSDDELRAYRRDGYLILRGRFSPGEIDALQNEAERLYRSDLVDPDNLRTPMRPLPDGTRGVERVDPVIDVSDLFRRVLSDERVLEPVRRIFGEPAHLFKDKLIFKHPGMCGYSMHQDYAWWQPQGNTSDLPEIAPEKILSVMIAIDPADALNGAIELFPGYHDRLLTPPGLLTNLREEELGQIDLQTGVLGVTAPGDIVLFHSLTPHRSESNRSTGSRRQLYMTYNAASAGDIYASQQAHYRAYMQAARKKNNQPPGFLR